MKATTVVLLLAVTGAVLAVQSDPRPSFPTEFVSKATMYIKGDQPDQYEMVFEGENVIGTHLDSVRVAWTMYSVDDKGHREKSGSILFTLDNAKKVQKNVSYGKDGKAGCASQDYQKPVFNPDWSKNSEYQGVSEYKGTMCRVWTNTLPYFGRQTVSTYYQHYFEDTPVAFDNEEYTLEFHDIRPHYKITAKEFDLSEVCAENEQVTDIFATISDGFRLVVEELKAHSEPEASQPLTNDDDQIAKEKAGYFARELVRTLTYGSLSSLQTTEEGKEHLAGYPFSSVADFVDADPSSGRPILLLSELEKNIKNMHADGRMTLTVEAGTTMKKDPMTVYRMTMYGTLNKVADDKLPAVREAYLAKHPAAKMWIDFSDFALYELDVKDIFWVGGFGGVHYIGYVDMDSYWKQ